MFGMNECYNAISYEYKQKYTRMMVIIRSTEHYVWNMGFAYRYISGQSEIIGMRVFVCMCNDV